MREGMGVVVWVVVLALTLIGMVTASPAAAVEGKRPQDHHLNIESLQGTAFPVKHYILNLDLPPQERWKGIIPAYKDGCLSTLQTLQDLIPIGIRAQVMQLVYTVGSDIEYFLGPLGQEITGVAQVLGVPVGEIVMMNLFYEIVALCTSIVAETPDGTIYHARNLDFGIGLSFTDGLRNLTIEVEFQKGGKTLFTGVTYAGYVGMLTGMAPQRFSVSVNERLSWDIIGNLMEILTNSNASVVSFLVRHVLETASNYTEALQILSTHPLIADCYIILAGTKSGEGAVITRERESAEDIWQLDAKNGRWFEVETNYDHWSHPPWWDDRIDPANIAMNDMGRTGISFSNLLSVLTIKPVLNLKTTYTALMSPFNGRMATFRRTCPDPCPF